MYGHYAPQDSFSDAPATTTTSSAGGGGLTSNSSLLDVDKDRLFSTSKVVRKESNGNLPKPIRWNTATKNKQSTSDANSIKSSNTTKKLFPCSPVKDNLNTSFIEDPDMKMLETPVHGKSGASYTSTNSTTSRQGDSGSFTEDLQKNSDSLGRSYVPSHDSRLEDSSLIRAFLPLSMNHDVSDLSSSIQNRSRAISPSRERNTMDSGSFTAETNQDLYRMHPAQIHTTNIHQYTKPQIITEQQLHTDVKPKYRPVRRPVHYQKAETARRALDQDNKENKSEVDPFGGEMVLSKLTDLDIHNKDEGKHSSQARNVEGTPSSHQHQDMTHPTNRNFSHPSGFNPVTHQPEFKHSSLRQQSCSRLKSAPSLSGRPGLTEQQQHNEVKDVLENLDMMHRPSFTADTTDTGAKKYLEMKTPQTQKQLPAYIQNILNKGLTKPGVNSSSSAKRDNVRSRYNSNNTDTATRHQDSTFPYGGATTTATANSHTKPSSGSSIISSNSGEKVTDDFQLIRRDVSLQKPNRYDSLLEPTYPSNTRQDRQITRPTLPEILERSTENNHSRLDSTKLTHPCSNTTQPTTRETNTEKTSTNDEPHPNIASSYSTTQYHHEPHHHAMAKSKSVSNVQGSSYKQQPPPVRTTPPVEPTHAHTLPENKPVLETSHAQSHAVTASRATPVGQQRHHPEHHQPPHQQVPQQIVPQQQICDDRTPRPVESAHMMRPPAPATSSNSSMPPPPMSLPAPASNSSVLVINNKRYMILKVVGKGGSSKVYEAVDELKNNVVAIKVVDLSHTDEAQAAGYVNEISMLAKLQGEDRIVKLFDYENDQKREVLYVVMEKGDTDLASLLKNYAIHKEITPAMVKHYWTEMLHAVHVIHKRGIIHSDLKPANFLLVAGRLKLIDFGIASSVQSDMTSVMKDTQMGTFNFMSPEAIQDLSGPRTDESGARRPLIKISYKSDVWSLGCILYNLAYGKMPFGDIKIPVMKLQAILNPDHQIPFPPENVDPLLLAVIKDCLTRDVKIRPSIEELLQHSYVTGIEAGGKAGSSSEALKSHMLAKLETNLQGVLSPGTFEKMKRAFQDPSLAKNLDI